MFKLWTPFVWLLASCTTNPLDVFEVCDLEFSLAPVEGAPETVITATGGPFTEARDTIVRVGGVAAEVVAVTADLVQTGDTAVTDLTLVCEACDTCRFEAGCGPCGSCAGERLDPARRHECFGDPLEGTLGACDLCRQQVSFIVPPVASGLTSVWMANRNGTSAAVPFTVLGPTSVGATGLTGDTGPTPTPPTADTSDTGS